MQQPKTISAPGTLVATALVAGSILQLLSGGSLDHWSDGQVQVDCLGLSYCLTNGELSDGPI